MISLVIDSNILFSALYNIKGLERRILDLILEKDEIQLFAPDILWEELRRNLKIKLNYKTNIIDAFISDFDIIEIPFEEYKVNIIEARKLSSHKNDIPFLAASLLINSPIWSGNEKHFKHLLDSKKIIWFNTRRLYDYLKKEGYTI